MSSIHLEGLTKRYGRVTALDDLTAEIRPGRVTAFLGRNGSGKTTTMRMILGLSAPDAGRALIDGAPYTELRRPLSTVGAVLDQGFHPNRSARNHLRIVAAQAEVARTRVEQVLGTVGLADAADRRVAGYSLGMRQRLALASALIGDPSVLVLDEPFNGLDPDGIATTRHFVRSFADAGGTVFLSSHLLAEIASVADDVIVIDSGRLVRSAPLRDLRGGSTRVAVVSNEADQLAIILGGRGADIEREGPTRITVGGVSAEQIAAAAVDARIVVTELRPLGDDLESVFQSLISSSSTSVPTDNQEVR
jgi:ABC-2 type transport system ATP-binding protein